ncbi:MAG: hypothetical protein AAF958_12380 [Planctomycetota bacterium]
MQLDRTHLKIRTRTISELGDLALVMLRRYPGAFGVAFLVGALPWILIDFALLAWIPIRENEIGLTDTEAVPELLRYAAWMATLVFLQAPMAGVATTFYLGQAVFEEKPTYADVWRACRKRFWRWFWVLGWIRLPMLAVVLLCFRFGQPVDGFYDGFLPFCFLVPALAVRASRPFMPEILLLEQCPIRSEQPHGLTAAKRSTRLHVPLSAELNGRFVVIGIVFVGLVASLYYTLDSAASLLSGNAAAGTLWPLLVFYPAALWMIAAVSVLIRLLVYLDSRIRLEGWDVELAIRAEQIRQFGIVDARAVARQEVTPVARQEVTPVARQGTLAGARQPVQAEGPSAANSVNITSGATTA